MAYISILQRLVDNQQFTELKSLAAQYYTESGDISALPLLAMAHAYLGERQSVEHQLTEIRRVESELDSDALVDLAAVLMLISQAEEAMTLLDGVLKDHPNHVLALARRAWCFAYQDNFSDACDYYLRSLAIAPERIVVYANLIQLYLELKNIEQAQQTLDKAIEQLGLVYGETPDVVVELYTARLRQLQLSIWINGEAFSQAEAWLESKQTELDEDVWVALLLYYAVELGGADRQAQAEEVLRDGVKQYPENIPMLNQLADLALLQGRTTQALHLLRKAITCAEKHGKECVSLWGRLSRACLHQFNEQARHAAEKAMQLANAMEADEVYSQDMLLQLRVKAKTALAQVESEAENFEIAEPMFRTLLEENPYSIPVLQGLGQQLMQCGKIDEAIELFERIKMIDPAQGYSALINARQFPEDESTLERIEIAARKPSMAGSVRSSLLLQLALAWEKRKEYDRAFALAEEGNNAYQHTLNYDAEAHRNRSARIRHAFSSDLYKHRKNCGVGSTLPVFVLGMPRSGTTLVEQILASHSKIFGAGELGVVPQVIQGLERWERHVGSGRHYPDCVDDLNPSVTQGIAENILKELQEFSPESKHIVDKLPHNFENIGLIKFLFPQAKIISVRRDPRDIAMSNYFTDYQAKHGGMGFAYNMVDIGQQLADHNALIMHWHQLFPGEILEINYEDVVDDTEGSARRMLEYIGVDWEPQVLAFNELDRAVKTASVWQVRQPIYKTSKAKWERYQSHLGPLIEGTNGKITWDSIEMPRLPEPGMLVDGVAFYNDKKWDEAEYAFKKLLHHIPEHAAANFMVGLVYAEKGHVEDAIVYMEKGFEQCPWNKNWRQDLIQVYELTGEHDKAEGLKKKEIKQSSSHADWDGNSETDVAAEAIANA
ncbi:MAG: sulfotransferase [Ghiorsea sp.]